MTETATEQSADQSVDAPDSDLQDVDFFNVHQLTRTQNGIYLDDEERRHAEDVRARLEDREPDYENMPATAGTPLTTEAGARAVLGIAADLNLNPEPHQTLEVDQTDVGGVVTSTSPVPAPEDATEVEPVAGGTATTYVVDGENATGGNPAEGETSSLNPEQLGQAGDGSDATVSTDTNSEDNENQ